MEIIKNIVNKNYLLVGFVVTGSYRELGINNIPGIGANIIYLNKLKDKTFINHQIEIRDKEITEKDNFKLNELGCYMVEPTEDVVYTETITLGTSLVNTNTIEELQKMSGLISSPFNSAILLNPEKLNEKLKLIKIDNDIEVSKPIYNEGNIIGYEVIVEGYKLLKFRTSDIERLSKWFKIKGIRLNKEVKNRAASKTTNKKRENENNNNIKKSNMRENNTKKIENKDYGESVLGIMEYLLDRGSLLFRPEGEKYNKSGDSIDTENTSNFTLSGIGEVAKPYLNKPEKNLNANINFRKIGIFTIPVDDQIISVPAYIASTKSLIKLAKVNIESLIAIIDQKNEEEFKNKFGKFISPIKIDLDKLNKIITIAELGNNSKENSINPNTSVCYSVNFLNMPVATNQDIVSITSEELLKIVEVYINSKAQEKLLKGIEKETKQIAESEGINLYTNTNNVYDFPINILRQMEQLGLDYKTGMARAESKKSSTQDKNKQPEMKKEIEFELYGANDKSLTFDNMKSGYTLPILNENFDTLIIHLDSIEDTKDRYEYIKRVMPSLSKLVNQSKDLLWEYKLWLHIEGKQSNDASVYKNNGWEIQGTKGKKEIYLNTEFKQLKMIVYQG